MDEHYYAIGETAGKIYQSLEKNSKTEVQLQKDIQVSDTDLFHQALGWLARENKIIFGKVGKTSKITLC